MNSLNYKSIRGKFYVKLIPFILLLFVVNMVMSQERGDCNKLECMDEEFINKNFVTYYNILNKTLIDAKGCNDENKLDVVLEFTTKIRKSVGSRERMAKFIEKQFINHPACILLAMKRISQDARYKTSLYLAKPTAINKKKIKSILREFKKQYPEEIQLILKEEL